MDFLWSSLLLLLLLLPVLVVVYVWSLRRRRRSAVRYSSLALVREAEPGSSRLRRHLPFALFVAALAALVFAMARPVAVVAVPTNQTTIILTIDVSGSMCSTDIPPSRLQAAEAAAASFINSQSSTTRIGIVAFSSFAEVVQAPTNDRTALLDALDSLATGRRTAHRRRHPGLDRRHLGDRPGRGQEPDRLVDWGRSGTRAQGRLRAGHHRPAHRRREQHRHATRLPPPSRRPTGACGSTPSASGRPTAGP